MKQEFLDFLNALMEAAPDVAEKLMTDNIQSYINVLKDVKTTERPIITDNGKLVLKYMQDNPDTISWKARDIAEGLFVSSRMVSGSLRKLVNDGFVDKIGQDPVIYTITSQGKNFIIE